MTTVRISPELSAYLKKKGYQHIIVDLAQAKSCGGAIAETFARPASMKEAQHVPARSRKLEAEGVAVLVVAPTLTIDDEVSLGLRSFLGIKDITVKGIRL